MSETVETTAKDVSRMFTSSHIVPRLFTDGVLSTYVEKVYSFMAGSKKQRLLRYFTSHGRCAHLSLYTRRRRHPIPRKWEVCLLDDKDFESFSFDSFRDACTLCRKFMIDYSDSSLSDFIKLTREDDKEDGTNSFGE